MSKEQITTTPLHFDFHNISHLGWVLLVAVGLCLIFVFILNVVQRETDFAYSRGEFIFSMGVLLIIAFSILFCMLTPISVTQRTSIRTQTFQILEKRSTSRDLEFLVKDHENVVSVKKIDFTQENVEVKVNEKSDSYTATTEIVTYEGHPWLQLFKNVPESTVKTTISLPQKFIK
ncbi:hypothetical protein [uncultured Lactococcus sp.]|uniref:hypothetical protein n=1 Tax=uncultured Lactococcus sp. TaxID=167973 RepID=UPI0027DE53BC|nr:hypothetical protein [uncultured Lactococcus sp.]